LSPLTLPRGERSVPRVKAVAVRFGPCVLDSDRRELRRGGEPVHLSPKAFDLLRALLERRPQPLSKAELRQRLWPSTFVHDANLPNLVAELRTAIGDDARRPSFVRTVHGYGYAFAGPVTEGEATTAEAETHPFLYCLHGQTGLATLVEGDHLLGRSHESAVYLDAPSISRRHARLHLAHGYGVLEDLGSRHGTFVKGERLTGPQRLDDGDELRLGSVVLTFRVLRGRDAVDTD
jgi:DNA-binding winged helix-turn-helix (wHTH) protein